MNFLRQLFTDLSCEHSFAIITWLLGAFLIGWIARYFASLRKLRNTEETLERSKLELKQSKKLRDGLQEKFDLKEADYQKATLSLTDRSKQINILESEKKQLNKRMSSTLDEYDKAKSEHTQTATRLEELNDQILGLRTKNSQLNSELQQSTATINQYADTQTSVTDTRYGELETVIAQLRSENANLKKSSSTTTTGTAEVEALEQKIAKLELEKDQWSESISEVTQLEEGNAALNASMMQLIEQNESLKEQVEELAQYESGNDILNTTVLQLLEENEALKTKKTSSTSTTVITHTPKEASVVSTSRIVESLSADQAKAEIRAAIGSTIKYATPAEKDDLKKIQGIGPFIEEKLNDLGIYTFEQLSQIDESKVPTLTAAIEFFPGRIERDEWIGQADRLFYMKGSSGSSTPTRRVISRTVVTRPKEESFITEKKAVQEKIIVDTPAPQKVTRVIRREPIRRVERIVRKEPIRKEVIPTPTEKVELPKPPIAKVVPEKEITTIKRTIPTPASSPGLKESVSRKIDIPPVVVPPVEMEEVQAVKEEVVETPEETAAVEELFAEESITTSEESTVAEETTEESKEAASTESETAPETEEVTAETEEAIPVPAAPVVPDDLKKIEGIGPKISTLLNNAGILTFAQLAAKSHDDLQDIIDDGGPRFRIARPKSWPDQAALAAEEKWDDLKAYQNRLRGGTLFPE